MIRHKSTTRPMAALLLIPILLAQTSPTTAPQNTKPEIERLQVENAELRSQVAALKAQLAEKRTSTAPASTRASRAFTSMQDFLVNAPADIRPQANPDWYKYTQSKFDAWWESQLVGMSFDLPLAFQSAYVARPTWSRPGAEWEISSFVFASKSFTYFGADHSWRISIPTIQGDEAVAKKWDNTKVGTLLRVKGTIAGVDIKCTQDDHKKLPTYVVTIQLRDVELSTAK